MTEYTRYKSGMHLNSVLFIYHAYDDVLRGESAYALRGVNVCDPHDVHVYVRDLLERKKNLFYVLPKIKTGN